MQVIGHSVIRLTISCLLPLAILCAGCGTDKSSNPSPSGPQIQSLLLNDGSAYTVTPTVTVSVTCTNDESIDSMRISESADLSEVSWQGYADDLTFQLSSGDGLKTVYAQVKDASGNQSETISVDIALAAATTVVGISRCLESPSRDGQSTDAVDLELWVANVTNMYSAVFKLQFDPALASASSVEVDFPEHILRSEGASLVVSNRSYDNETGTIIVGALPQQSGFEGITGSGPFARITLVPGDLSQTSAVISFVPGEWSTIYATQVEGPPAPIEEVLFIDCTLVP